MNKKIKILLIEDDKIEVLKFNRAITPVLENHIITQANNGKEALSLLEKDLPNIILLDLNMPDTNGIEFLSILKNDEKLKHIPTIVLTTSDNDKDITECYRLGIAGYVLKPLKYQDYEKKIGTIIGYWSLNEFKK
ncbi:response regulator [Tenacibaculum larymnensis]|uniref:Response regulator n=1 Tax=Tenacibaculum larymnensis TaxID=2878201 RepID=A0A9X4ERN7_9FLAO|nr:response regulator [Tenacibaculum larymnensis]MDE1207617.1 response regulator [Tenacibaculum larymnensis]